MVPIFNALNNKSQIYDLFLCIVPTAGRGNPGHNSKFLSKVLNKYRKARNSKAKYVKISITHLFIFQIINYANLIIF